MNFNARQWLIYIALWIPYTASYLAVFVVQGANKKEAFYTTLLNIIPAILLGILVIRLCRRFEWNDQRRAGFLFWQLLFAVAYTLSWYLLVVLFLTISQSIRMGSWSPSWLTGFALQWQMFSGVMIYATIACIIYLLQTARNLRNEERRAARIEALYAQTRLSALRAQLNPHFLFNTLHSMMALTRSDPAQAEVALEKLAEMLRYVLRDQKEDNSRLISVRDEWEFVQNYLALEKMRLGPKLKIEAKIDPAALDFPLPAFTLQPLVENAVKHGISLQREGGTILISAARRGNKLELLVKNNKPKLPQPELAVSNKMGLALLKRQLETVYADQGELTINDSAAEEFSVEITLPLPTAAAGDLNS